MSTATIITTDANEMLAPVHDRMAPPAVRVMDPTPTTVAPPVPELLYCCAFEG